LPEPRGQDSRNSIETRVRLLEEWRGRHKDEFEGGVSRLNQLWDWMTRVKPQLASIQWTLRAILVAILIFIAEQVYFHLQK
jgi:hypothetical protein